MLITRNGRLTHHFLRFRAAVSGKAFRSQPAYLSYERHQKMVASGNLACPRGSRRCDSFSGEQRPFQAEAVGPSTVAHGVVHKSNPFLPHHFLEMTGRGMTRRIDALVALQPDLGFPRALRKTELALCNPVNVALLEWRWLSRAEICLTAASLSSSFRAGCDRP